MKTLLEVKSVKFEQLNNDEYAQFMKSVLNLIQNASLEKLSLDQEVYDMLQKHHEDLTEATRQNRFSNETKRITELDKQRCNYLVFLLSSFRFEQKNAIVERKEAASVLHKNMRTYSGIQSLPLRQKSQTIEGFLKDINKPEFEQYVNTLGVRQTITSLAEVNKECQKLIEGRAESQITNTLINTKKVRREATKLYRYLTKCAVSSHTVFQSSESATFITLLNKLVTDTMNAHKLRTLQPTAKPTLTEDKTDETQR
ncbi:hypothetical protein CGC58_06690 [Capnocytophaga stomatis]|uniref:Uncharacterized protein n=1 Tax=Capnocytophaga stomatis TaxID=1848904 RepID=A0A250FWA2_9FLAO|nr:DUF6261 family protein [Capnocytophaga stomatis]ATA89439.1 hypothetical protein CGC58_06690 [Capnocytophaga stomatis]